MQIKRNILGTDVVIDLTEGEILDAHYEVERYNTQEMLNERLMQEENIIDEIPPELLRQMVKEVMIEKDTMDSNMGSNIFPAMNAVIEKHKDELKKEEPWGLFEIECTQTRKVTWTIRAKSDDDAERIFEEWREHHIREYDMAFEDAEVSDEEIDSAYACEGNPEYADIIVEG
jgi:hypothetical protein